MAINKLTEETHNKLADFFKSADDIVKYVKRIEEVVTKLMQNGYTKSEITIERYIDTEELKYYLNIKSDTRDANWRWRGRTIITQIKTKHHQQEVYACFFNNVRYESGDYDSYYTGNIVPTTSIEYHKSKNDEGEKIHQLLLKLV